jgi:hypothetical protein
MSKYYLRSLIAGIAVRCIFFGAKKSPPKRRACGGFLIIG